MMIHEITTLAGKYKARKRVGRGTGSGTGRRSGRGQKGASSRSGYSAKTAFEGGQMPYFRRLRKFGFSNFNFTTRYWIVNLRSIVAHPMFAKGGDVNAQTLIQAGLIRDLSRDLKILGDLPTGKDGKGEKKGAEAKSDTKLGVKLTVTASRVSAQAKALIEGSGGSVTETGTRRDKVRGIDRMSDDKSPKNLTKKLKRGGKKAAPVADEPAEDSKDDKKKSKAKPADKPAGKAPADKGGEKPA